MDRVAMINRRQATEHAALWLCCVWLCSPAPLRRVAGIRKAVWGWNNLRMCPAGPFSDRTGICSPQSCSLGSHHAVCQACGCGTRPGTKATPSRVPLGTFWTWNGLCPLLGEVAACQGLRCPASQSSGLMTLGLSVWSVLSKIITV